MFICILQCIPSISITGGIPYSLIPLTFVLFFDGVVTAREDFKRHQEDQAANARNTLVYRRNQGFRPTPWRDVVVGDVVKVRERLSGGPCAWVTRAVCCVWLLALHNFFFFFGLSTPLGATPPPLPWLVHLWCYRTLVLIFFGTPLYLPPKCCAA